MKLGIWQKRMRSEKESMAMTKMGILPWILTKSPDSIDIKRLVWYNPSLPLADAKWSLLRLHFFSICAICSVFMRSLEF